MLSATLGGLAAITASTITHPVDSLKVRMFLHGEGKSSQSAGLGLARTIYQTEGIRKGFYSGVTATWLRQALFSTSRFGVNDYLQTKLGKKRGTDISIVKKLASSAIAGGAASLVSCPADTVLVQMQADGKLPPQEQRRYKNVFSGIRTIVATEGVGGLYRGLYPLVARGTCVTAGQFTTYDVTKKFLLTSCGMGDNTKTHLMASTVAGTVSALIVNPLDVIKSRMMQSKNRPTGYVSEIAHYTGVTDCIVKTYSAEGIRGFYKGLSTCFLRQCPQVIFMWVIFEQYNRLYKRITAALSTSQAALA